MKRLTGFKSILVALSVIASATKPMSAAEQPDILLILADDLGWNDVGYHGSPIETPNIDRIAQKGIELNRFYAQPSCSPTRTALMTGKSPVSLGIYRPLDKNSENGVPLSERMIPQYLAELGYQSFVVGKWHLGHHKRAQLPNQRGFEHFYGSLTGGIGYWNKVHGGGYDLQRNGVTVREDGYVTHLLVEEVTRLIKSRDKNRPNFMYLAFQAPHLPNEAPASTIKKYVGRFPDNEVRHIHAAMVDEMDKAIGDVLAVYEEEGMLENTIILFMSDNGGLIPPGPPEARTGVESFGVKLGEWFDRPLPIAGLEFIVSSVYDAGSDNSPLPGGKMKTAEGGVRVPAAMMWTSMIDPAVHELPMTASDILPTLLEMVGGALDMTLDGQSQWLALQGQTDKSIQPDYVTSGLLDSLAIYHWPWKLVTTDPVQLYDVIDDPLEETNLASSRPDMVKVLQEGLAQWDFAEDPGIPVFELLTDPDVFGGVEDGRLPWADAVVD